MTNTSRPWAREGLPPNCSVAFKEWAGICRALILGRQSVILRKGGIAEDSGTFEPDHRVFWLFPTRLHEPDQGLRAFSEEPDDPLPSEPGWVLMRALAVVDRVGFLDDERSLDDLKPLHVWTEETVRKRFQYRKPGFWVLGVRVWARTTPHRIVDRPEYAGCRSWVPLAEPISTEGLSLVLDDRAHEEAMDRLSRAVGVSVLKRTEGAVREG